MGCHSFYRFFFLNSSLSVLWALFVLRVSTHVLRRLYNSLVVRALTTDCTLYSRPIRGLEIGDRQKEPQTDISKYWSRALSESAGQKKLSKKNLSEEKKVSRKKFCEKKTLARKKNFR